MKKYLPLCAFAAICLFGLLALTTSRAATESAAQPLEYATLQRAGRDYIHSVKPDGKVDFYAAQFSRMKVPDGADERSFFMNAAMNNLARDGYSVVSTTEDQIIMGRAARH